MKKTEQISFDYNDCFKKLYYHLYSNGNTSRAETIVSDVTKLLLFKLASEKDETLLLNRISGSNIISALEKLYPESCHPYGEFSFDDETINVAFSIISNIRLSSAPAHIIGDAFQAIIGPKIRGDKGQFFTPYEVVECMVDIMSDSNSGIVVDPACGTGGFLIESFSKHSDMCSDKEITLIGIDKDRDMYDLAVATTEIVCEGNNHIYNSNSLEIIYEEHELNYLVGSVDLILTNPPFGSKIGITDKALLSEYEFGHNWMYSEKEDKWYRLNTLVKNQSPQVLFIELCVNLLQDGGKMAIVLPEGIFGNKTLGFVWSYLREHGNIIAMIDCPRNTFQPSTDTKTNILFYQKGKPLNDAFKVAVAKNCGHDKRGRTTSVNNVPIKNDFKLIAENFHTDLGAGSWKTVCCDSSYCVPRYLYEKAELANLTNTISLGELLDNGYLRKRKGNEIGSEAYGSGDIPFIRTSDISNFEISSDPTNSVSEDIYNRYAEQQNLEVGDILFIADGRYRIGKTAIITEYNKKCIIQSHINILSLSKDAPITAYELLYLLNEESVQEQIRSLIFIQSTLGTLGHRIREIEIKIPERNEEWNKKIHAFQECIEMRAKCLANLRNEEHGYEL